MEIRAQAGPDRPRAATVLAVALGGLGVGLALARGAVGVAPPGSIPAPAAEFPSGSEPTSLEAEAGPSPLSDGTLAPDEVASPAIAAIDPATAPAAPDPIAPIATGPAPGEAIAAAPPPTETPGAVPPTPSARIVHGRVAYLRCEGVPAPEGETPSESEGACPRDRPLEALVWAAIDSLAACPTRPLGEGEADLVVDLGTGAAPEVRTRDRFAPEVVRLDGEAIVECVSEALTTASSSLGAARLVVSFRFRAVP